MHIARGLLPGIVIACVLLCGCSGTAPSSSLSSSPDTTTATAVPRVTGSPAAGTFSLTVDGVPAGSALPATYTCTGSSTTPGIAWTNVPAGTKSLAVILDDPDAPSGTFTHWTFTHWILYNIPATTLSIDSDQPNAKVLSDGTQVGTNTAGSRGYYPPCPPVGTTHRYLFRLYAVDMAISQPTADRASIDWALSGHTLGEAQVTTTFTR
ncbi:MAG: YbhB/YbcL family Raf kinase inhibitor-like protein [Methanoregula sp.]|nr:YbhB/YbcL family Raf kinase inhibitor-like protein [Methanoregula sp.]